MRASSVGARSHTGVSADHTPAQSWSASILATRGCVLAAEPCQTLHTRQHPHRTHTLAAVCSQSHTDSTHQTHQTHPLAPAAPTLSAATAALRCALRRPSLVSRTPAASRATAAAGGAAPQQGSHTPRAPSSATRTSSATARVVRRWWCVGRAQNNPDHKARKPASRTAQSACRLYVSTPMALPCLTPSMTHAANRTSAAHHDPEAKNSADASASPNPLC